MRRSSTGSAEQQARGNFTPPSRAEATPGEEPEPASPAPGGGTSRYSPRNWSVPTRLNAILLLPVLVGLFMGGIQVSGSIDTWDEAKDAEKTAKIVRAASEYGAALLNERDLTAEPLLKSPTPTEAVQKVRATTDAAKAKFDRITRDIPQGHGLERRLEIFRGEEKNLAELRENAYRPATDPVGTEQGYVQVQHSLMAFANELGLGTGNVTSYGRTVYAVQLAKAAASLQRSIGIHLLVRPNSRENVRDKQVTAFNSYNYLEQIAIAEFQSGGTSADAELLKTLMRKAAEQGAQRLQESGSAVSAGPDGTVFSGMAQRIGSGAAPRDLANAGITPRTWTAVATAKFEGYLQVETELVDRAVAEASSISADARRDAILNGAIVVIALLASFVLAGAVARQMSRSMRELRSAAFAIAEQRLPLLVDQLSRTEPGRVDTRVEPIPIDTRDEIGEVARAFDQIHREAVRLAAEQAMLRGNVNAIFTNLSRRNQSLIEGQLGLITELENNEADPDQLESLFRLDHLATRMRRNGENLLVLAGEEPGRRWNQPVPLVDVLRAASSEVESYERIELSGVPETEIHGQSVTDLVHLLAELLENATTFSSPQTKVRVTATRLPDGRIMVEIHDKGIGLTAEDFADINHKLANPPTVDASVSQRMGLFVVGRLADRHGIRVQLRPSGEQAGTTSLVMLPDAITHGGGGEPTPQDDFTVSGIIPEQESRPNRAQVPSAPLRTAAELGFDDSRYEQPQSGGRGLDPVGRSLARGGRRAALEAQSAHQPPAEQPPGYQQPAGEQPFDGYAQGGFPGQGQVQGQGQIQGQGQVPGADPYAAQGGSTGTFPAPDLSGGTAPYGSGQQTYDGYPADGYQGGGAHHTQPMPVYRETPDQAAAFPGAGTSPESPQPHGTYEPQYPAGGYPESGFPDSATGEQPSATPWNTRAQQDDWPEPNALSGGYEQEYRGESESGHSGPTTGAESVGFERPGPSPSSGHQLTDAGLPRRGAPRPRSEQDVQRPQQWQPSGEQVPQAPQGAGPEAVTDSGNGAADGGAQDWRSANDERWQRAEKLREPKAGGVTSSGLPRRVPKANLVEGTAEETPQHGLPQISRAPEDVRGRLSNLRRGVQRGRSAGTDTNGPATHDHQGGPGSTYNQER
ncbi:sensor histidine kinase [Streptomyces qinzhouensis]|uniref:histidine kinase n=1 Tax=Streptomyces qinzhouensis TaxID=2599401 RepID=A0A5B8IKZ9_9ACTN|nr:nitrate- and nitrite sensing domain-containing protein [Streptomyces qinzhouensis]QDY79198.1 HAMP domain-containing protein [Streptomyces qinzhouensis]